MSEENEQLIPTPSDFGHFTLERELGHGGMGGVYLARDKMLDRQVAIKVMLKSLGDDPAFVARFQREAQAAAKLNHPNIAQIYSFGTEQGMPYIAMELVSGGSLDKDMMEHPGQLDPNRVMKIGQQLVDALALAADQGLVHGDVKPENVLFDAEGNAKLVDFGLAAMQGDSDEIWGTPYYISPEKVRKQKVDYRADIYSLGGTLYHALTGVAPFEGEDATAVVRARFDGAPAKPSEVRPDLPPELDSIIMRMLELEPAMRYPTYKSLMGDFKRYLAKAGTVKTGKIAVGPKVKIRGTKIRMKLTADDNSGNVPPMGDVADIPDLPPDAEPQEEKHVNLGLVIGGVAVGVVLLIGAVVGGLFWYKHAEKAREQREYHEQIVSTQTKAREAIAGTMKAADDFGRNFHDLVARNDKIIEDAVRQLKAALPDEIKEVAMAMIEPPPTADIAEAIAYTNELFTAAANGAKAAAEAAAKAADTNAPPAKAEGTNAPPAKAAKPLNKDAEAEKALAEAEARVAAGKKAEEKKPDEKKADEKKPEEKKAEEVPAEEKKEEAAEETKEEEEKPAESELPKMEVPAAVKQFVDLWAELYFCRASDIRVQGSVLLLKKNGEKVKTLTAEDEETTKALGKLSVELNDQFGAIKTMKCVELTQRKANVIRTKSTSLLRSAQQQISRAKVKLEKAMKDAAEKKAREEAAAKAAEEHKAKVEEETNVAREKFDFMVSSRLKSLDWENALKQLNTTLEDLTTSEGREEMRFQIEKVRAMQGLHQHLVRYAKDFKFKNGAVVTATDAKSLTIQTFKSVKGKAEPLKSTKVEWSRFYGKKEHVGYMNQFINRLVMNGRDTTHIGPKPWSSHMLGAALTLQLLYGEVDGAAEFAPKLVQKAVKEFDSCRKNAERWFPDVELEKADE